MSTPTAEQLVGRVAVCYHCKREEPSAGGNGTLEYRGEGSESATLICQCGYHKCAHVRQPGLVDPRSVQDRGDCKTGFVARGPAPKDTFYCGCNGWD